MSIIKYSIIYYSYHIKGAVIIERRKSNRKSNYLKVSTNGIIGKLLKTSLEKYMTLRK